MRQCALLTSRALPGQAGEGMQRRRPEMVGFADLLGRAVRSGDTAIDNEARIPVRGFHQPKFTHSDASQHSPTIDFTDFVNESDDTVYRSVVDLPVSQLARLNGSCQGSCATSTLRDTTRYRAADRLYGCRRPVRSVAALLVGEPMRSTGPLMEDGGGEPLLTRSKDPDISFVGFLVEGVPLGWGPLQTWIWHTASSHGVLLSPTRPRWMGCSPRRLLSAGFAKFREV